MASAVAVAVFGFLQWRITDRAEAARERERTEDDLRAFDTAQSVLRAQWFDLWTAVRSWQAADLVTLARAGTIKAADLSLRDWTAVATALGLGGAPAGHMGSYAIALLRDAQKSLALFLESVEQFDNDRPSAPVAGAAYDSRYLPAVQKLGRDAVALAEEAVALMEDALRHFPGADTPRTALLQDTFRSKAGKRIAEEAIARDQSTADPAAMIKSIEMEVKE